MVTTPCISFHSFILYTLFAPIIGALVCACRFFSVFPLLKMASAHSSDRKKNEKKDGAKRGRQTRSPDESGPMDDDPFDLQAAIKQLHVSVVNQGESLRKDLGIQGNKLSAQVTSVQSDVAAVRTHVTQIEASLISLRANVEQHDDDIQQILGRLTLLESQSADFKKQAISLDSRVVIAESAEPTAKPSGFDRAPDTSIAKVNCNTNVSKDAIICAVQKLVQDAGMEDANFVIKAPDVSNRFTIQFKGTGNIASRRASQLIMSLQDDDMHWKKIYVTDPTGAQVQIFVGPDKSPKRIRTEVLCKKVVGILKELGLAGDAFVNRAKGQISVAWEPLVMVEVGEDDAQLLWNKEHMVRLRINKDRVTELFEAVLQSRTNRTPIQWAS